MLSSTFIDRPRLSLVISIVITLAGLIALTALPIAQFPDIVPPQVQVTARYPGAGATVVEQTVAQPIESQVVGVDQALYMKSTSGNDGSYTLTVSFAVGTNPDINTVNVQNRVSLALPQLPEEVSRQGVTVKKKSSAILQVLAIYSPDSRYDTLFLSNYATINILDNIKRVPGVGDAYLFGALDYSMRVWLNTDRLTALGLTPTDVANALQGQNVQAAVGRIGAQPIGDAQFQLNIQTKGRLTEPEEFENVVVRANPDGSYVRVRDVGRVELAARTSDSFGRFNGGPGALIAIFQAPGANALSTAEGVQAVMQRLQAQFPEGVAYKTTYDSTAFVLQSIDEVIHTLIEAFILVVIVVFLFLGNLRATLIPLIAVPVSLIGTFAVMLALGFSLEHGLAAGPGAGDRHRGRRRHRRGRGGRGQSGGRPQPLAVGRRQAGHGPDHRTDPGDHAGAAVGVRAGGVHPGHLGPALPAVRGGGRRVDGDLGHQRADACRRPCAPCCCATMPARRSRPIRMVLGAIDFARDGYAAIVKRLVRVAFFSLVVVGGFLALNALAVQGDPRRLPAVGGPGRLLRRGAAARGRLGQPHRRRRRAGREAAQGHPRRRRHQHGGRLQHAGRAQQVQQRLLHRAAQAVRRADRRRRGRRLDHRQGARRGCRRSARPTSSRSTCRRSSASAPAAASSTSCSTCRAAIPPTSPRWRGR